jgi:hypothetical protein
MLLVNLAKENYSVAPQEFEVCEQSTTPTHNLNLQNSFSGLLCGNDDTHVAVKHGHVSFGFGWRGRDAACILEDMFCK